MIFYDKVKKQVIGEDNINICENYFLNIVIEKKQKRIFCGGLRYVKD